MCLKRPSHKAKTNLTVREDQVDLNQVDLSVHQLRTLHQPHLRLPEIPTHLHPPEDQVGIGEVSRVRRIIKSSI